ncbi:ATP-NAD kinase-like domain-containing protein [Scenedesmus sp. NREL 46B-D3]|nr:ATP-NAD kinase-like domain-containing protein [Scenedesmus sp. NREL 46B-D3]
MSDGAASSAPMKRAFLIYNPVAGQENPATILGDIALKLIEHYQLTVVQTKPDVAPEELAKQALKEKADLIIASGGDGTVGAIAGVLVGTGVPLGIVPRGTANAFSVALGIPTHLDDPTGFQNAAADVILAGHTKDVDTALVTTSEVTDYPMILLLGIGYEAEMCDAADRDLKNALGPLAYVISGAQKLLSASNFKATVHVDGEEAEGEVAAITVANAAPPFSVLAHGHTGECIYDDGKLEAIGYVAEEGGVTSKVKNVVNMARLFSGVMFSDEPVQNEEKIFGGRYSNIKIECDPPQKVVLDGELLGTTPVTARVLANSLRVLVPPPAAPHAEVDEELVHKIAEQEGVEDDVAELVVEKLGAETAAKVVDDPAEQAEDMPVVAASTEQKQ